MAVLEFVMILMAIVIGLGIAEVLRCCSRLLLADASAGRVHAVWLFVVFVHLVESMVAAWGFRGRADWSFLQIVVLLAPVAAVYMAATVLNAVPDDGDADDFLIERRRAFFGLLAMMTLFYSIQGWNVIFDWMAFGWEPDAFRVAALGLFGLLASSSSTRLHLAGSLLYLALVIVFVVIYSPSLSGVLTVPAGG